MIEVFQVSALQDNYIHILRNSDQSVAVVDPSEARPVNTFLKEKGWSLDFILNTHHHYDHVGGNLALKKKWGCHVVGFSKDSHRIPGIDVLLEDNQIWKWGKHLCHVFFIPGHTLGHVAFWFKKEKLLFCGDTLFGMGCGRLFEGTAKQMLSSLQKLSELPKDTKIYCGHEYTLKNGQFALGIEGDNPHIQKRMEDVRQKRKQGLSTVPFTMEEEKKTNCFLRCQQLLEEPGMTHVELQKWIQSKGHVSELDLFKKIREYRNVF